jgi:S-sulfo-L-cysteine synthase (O-acetyl-L-serine-dependent)
MISINMKQISIKAEPSVSLASAVGHTPLLLLRHLTQTLAHGVQLFAKAEWFNPGGSVKDRPALNIINTALAQGQLGYGKILLDSTSGNMGISYAMFGAAMDIRVTLVIPGNANRERMTILRALGAELIISDPLEGSDGAMRLARQMAGDAPEKYFYANQYDNPANWQAHYLTTGPELVEQTDGKITHLVAGLGTTGTMTGTGRFLREYNSHIHLVAVQPDSPFHGLEGLKHLSSAIRPGIYDAGLVDETIEIATEDAYRMVQRLAREEGLFVGISSAAAAQAALRVASTLDQGSVVVIFPDSGYKYLSEKFWEEPR